MRLGTVALVAMVALWLPGCVDQRSQPVNEDELDAQTGTSAEPDPQGSFQVVPVLYVDGALDDSDALTVRSLVWDAVPADDVATFLAAMAATHGQGTASLIGPDGRLLAEAPAEVIMDSMGGTSVHAFLLVPEHAETVERLHIELDEGAEVTVERDGDVELVRTEFPDAGPLDENATVSWEASSGTVEGGWLVGSGDPAIYGPWGTAKIGGASLPAEGGWLILVAYDGLAFDLEVAGPYLHPDGGGSPVEWRVFIEGDDIGETGTVEIDRSEPFWSADVTVWVLPPGGGDVLPDMIEAIWSSDRQGDLADVNGQQAPSLWVHPTDLAVGEHVWTLQLEADLPDGGFATHEERLDVRVVGDPGMETGR